MINDIEAFFKINKGTQIDKFLPPYCKIKPDRIVIFSLQKSVYFTTFLDAEYGIFSISIQANTTQLSKKKPYTQPVPQKVTRQHGNVTK